MDIRDQPQLSPKDFLELNFVSVKLPYVPRYYYRQGLRSHIFELLNAGDYEAETKGILEENLKKYPKAKPEYMLRIYKPRINKETAIKEIEKGQEVRKYLKENMAHSTEFIVSYNNWGLMKPYYVGSRNMLKENQLTHGFAYLNLMIKILKTRLISS